MSYRNVRLRQVVVAAWAICSLVVALLPTGVGGVPRALYAIAFLVLGPGVAILTRAPAWPVAIRCTAALGTSVTALVLGSQLLLILGLWSAPGVAVLVALATVALALAPPWTRPERSSEP